MLNIKIREGGGREGRRGGRDVVERGMDRPPTSFSLQESPAEARVMRDSSACIKS